MANRGLNQVNLIGTVGKDPEVKYFQSGDAYCTLSIATSESWKDKNGEKQEKTEWHNLKFTRKLAEIVGEYVRKGQQIYVSGKLETTKYTDKQGVERYSTAVVCNEMQMLGAKSSGGGDRQQDSQNDFSAPRPAQQSQPKPAASIPAFAGNDAFSDDVPF